MRKTYVINENQEPVHAEGATCNCEHDHHETELEVKGLLLFTSPTCPNCKMAKMLLDKAGIHYTNIDATTNRELVAQFGIKQAPTLIVPEGSGYRSFENASLIKGFIESTKIAQ